MGSIERASNGIQIGEAFSFVTNSPDWWKTCGKAGLFMLIPIAGAISLLGWERKVFEAYKRGDSSIPEYEFDVGYGVSTIVAALNVFPVVIIAVIIAAIIGGIGGAVGGAIGGSVGGILSLIAALVGGAIYLLTILFSTALAPELLRRGHKGEMGPLFSPGRSIAAVKSGPGIYFMLIVGTFVAGLAGGLGVIACYFGIFVTLPMSAAVRGALYAMWDNHVTSTLGPDA